jgi:2-oxoglutarate dehydrogenase E2 component (dihydrolipoamide succinyltransferase)
MSIIEIAVPENLRDDTEIRIEAWYKANGSTLKVGDLLLCLTQDKISYDIESPANGILTIIAPEGTTVSIGAIIAHLKTV